MANFNVIVDETNNQVIVNEDAQSIVIRSLGTVGPKGDSGADGADGVGVPPGGTTGQVLAKNSNADFDTEWVDQTGGGGGSVNSVNGQTGVVVLDTDDVAEGATNKYFSAAAAKAATVSDTITNGVLDVAPSQNAVFDALALKADDSSVVHKTGNETISGLKQFDNTFVDDQSHEGTDFYLTHAATAPLNGGNTVGVKNRINIDGNFDRTNWLESASQEEVVINGTGNHSFVVGDQTQVIQQGSGTVVIAAGKVGGAYCDNPAATIDQAAGVYGTVEAVQGTITEAVGVGGEVIRYPGATIDRAIAFKVAEQVEGTEAYGFYNQTSGAKNKFNETDFTGAVIPSVVALTDAATIAVNAALGNQFTVTLGGNRTLGNPTGAVNGQLLLFALRQDGAGSRTITLDTKFRLGADITSITLSTGANKTDYLGVRYHSSDDTFDVISFVGGF